MKFLLTAVNAKYIHSNLAIYSLKAYAGVALQPSVEIAEYTINQYPGEILGDIYRRKPQAVAFSCYIWNWRLIQDILQDLPKILPGVPVWLGGPEVTYDAGSILKQFPGVTGIMLGEGEETFRELLEYYVEEKGTGLEQIAGLHLSSGPTAPRGLMEMNRLPFPYDSLEPFRNRIIYYESSRGCPFRCSYCLSSIEKQVRLRDIDVVKKELQFFLDAKVAQVKFVDRTFNCDHNHAMAVWQYLSEHDNGVTNFHFEISADILREDEIALLRGLRPGLIQLEIGVQSANPRTIAAIRRVMDLERLERNVAAVREGRNIHQHLDLIAGLPFEDYESFGRSFNCVYVMRPDQLQLGFLKVLKGSGMQECAQEYGLAYMERPPYEVLSTNWLSFGELWRLKQIEEMVERYYNSGQYTHTLPFLEKAFDTPFAMFEEMASFYESRGYFTESPARAYRYQALLDFAKEHDPCFLPVYRELLTFDMYLRENLKSRPAFAVDMEPYSAEVREFYRQENTLRGLLPDYGPYDLKQISRMTHLEPFFYPVWEEKFMERDREPDDGGTNEGAPVPAADMEKAGYFVLFDYGKRNPLDHGAGITIIERR